MPRSHSSMDGRRQHFPNDRSVSCSATRAIVLFWRFEAAFIHRNRPNSMSDSIATKTYGTVSAAERKQMSGLEFVQGLAHGTLPLNTMAETLGYDVTEVASGRVVVTAT